ERLAAVRFAPERVPVYANTTAERYPSDAMLARDLLAMQLAKPVEFFREIESLYPSGVRTFVEVGPGKKINGLGQALLVGKPHESLAWDASAGKRNGITDLARMLAQLAALGHDVNLQCWEEMTGSSAPAPKAKPTLTVPIGGANYVKPRPAKPPRKANMQESV